MLWPKESLRFRCILKPAHSSAKLRLSRLLKSITFWAPTWIVKNVQKPQIFTEGAISTARVTCRSPSDMAYASPCISLHIRVCRLSIGPLVTEISAREATRPERFFAFFTKKISRGRLPFQISRAEPRVKPSRNLSHESRVCTRAEPEPSSELSRAKHRVDSRTLIRTPSRAWAKSRDEPNPE